LKNALYYGCKLFALTTCILFSIHGCKKDNEVREQGISKEYFPVNPGHEVVYDVELITKSSFTGLWDSSYFSIKEVIASTYLDNENRVTQRIERFIKNDTTPDWTIYKVWAANRLSTSAERYEDNIRYVKLNFAPGLGKECNGNSQNTMEPWMYRYSAIDQPGSLGNLYFDSTLTVIQFEDSNAVFLWDYTEQYATGIGMIYKENRELEFIPSLSPCDSCDNIEEAYIYRERAVSFVK